MSAPKLGAARPSRCDNLVRRSSTTTGIQLDNFVKKILDLEPVDRQAGRPSAGRCIEIDGHDVAQIGQGARPGGGHSPGRPTFIVAHTVKGKGVSFMENNPGVARQGAQARGGDRAPFARSSGQRRRGRHLAAPATRAIVDGARRHGEEVMPAKASPRRPSAKPLIDLGARDERIVTLDADLSKSTMTAKLRQDVSGTRLQPRDRGVQHDRRGGRARPRPAACPFACSFACFLVGRFETIRISVAYTRRRRQARRHPLPASPSARTAIARWGSRTSPASARCPTSPSSSPPTSLETKQAVACAVEHRGAALSAAHAPEPRARLPADDYRFQFGRWPLLRPGHDVTLVLATGGTLFNCAGGGQARWRPTGSRPRCINVASIKPLDEEPSLRSAGKTGHVVDRRGPRDRRRAGRRRGRALGEVMPTPIKRLGVTGSASRATPRASTPSTASTRPASPRASGSS